MRINLSLARQKIEAATRKGKRHFYGKARASASGHKKTAAAALAEYRTHKASGDRRKARAALLSWHSARAAYHSSWQHPNKDRAKYHLSMAGKIKARMRKVHR